MEIKTNNLQIVKNVLTDVVRQINKENILDNIKKYIFENVDKNLINAINYKWGYKLTAKTYKPIFDILETAEIGGHDHNAAHRFYIFLAKCYNFDDIDNSYSYEQELSRQLLLRLNTVYDSLDYITTLHAEKNCSSSTAQLIYTKAYKMYLKNDENFNIFLI